MKKLLTLSKSIIMKKSQTLPKTVRLNSSLVNHLEERAREENRNFSNMVETLLYKATNQQISL